MPFMGGGSGVTAPEVETIVETKIIADFHNPTTPLGMLLNPVAPPAFLDSEISGGYGTDHLATLPAHAVGDRILVITDRGDAEPAAPFNTPSGYESMAAVDGTRVITAVAPNTSTTLNLVAGGFDRCVVVALAYSGVNDIELLDNVAGNVSPELDEPGFQRFVFLIEGSTAMTDASGPGLVKRDAHRINAASAAAYDVLAEDGVVPSYTFPNAERVFIVGLGG